MGNRGIIYPHHNPIKQHDTFRRRVERFENVIQSHQRKLFVIIQVIESLAARWESLTLKGTEFVDVFHALKRTGCSNFELLAINLICGKPSDATSEPIKEPLRWGIEEDQEANCSLAIFDLHCVGSCTGLRLKSKLDIECLRQMCIADRNFALAEDPLEENVLKRPATNGAIKRPACQATTAVLHPARTVKRSKDGTWHMKTMD